MKKTVIGYAMTGSFCTFEKNLEQMQIGDVTVKRGSGSAAARCLRKQAQIIMFPFVEGNAPLRRV